MHDHRYIKTKIRTYSNKVCANFIPPEVNIEFKSFTVISIDSLLICQLQVYLDNCANKTVNKQLADLFEG